MSITSQPPAAVPTPNNHQLAKTLVLGAFAACLAWVLAQVGLKVAFAGIAGIGFLCALLLVRERERLTFFIGVLSLVAILHKSFGGIQHVSSGPPSLYINTVDVLVVMLYAMWFSTGTMGRDLAEQLRRPIIYLPLVAMLFMLPSFLVASTPSLSVAEMLRMAFEWLVLVYVAARVRRRADVWMVLAALATTVGIEFVVVLGQWVTHGPLGLSFLGTPETLNQRITDSSTLGRPFGTITHPVFMAAFLGPLALMAFCLAINLRGRKQKTIALAFAAMATIPMAISHTRSAALGVVIAGTVVVLGSLMSRRLRPRVVVAWIGGALMGALVLWNQVLALYHDNFHTQHFSLEVNARGQLYDLGWRMFDAHPLFGTGLNNFQQVMEPYNRLGLIFDGNPVHNLFLLQASETGLIGFIALPLAGLPVLLVALRVARSRDRLYSAIGTGVAAMFVFFIVEEMFVFSLRQDHPRTVFWLLGGLVAACARLMERPEELGEPLTADPLPARPRPVRRTVPAAAAVRRPSRPPARSRVGRPARHWARAVRAAATSVLGTLASVGHRIALPRRPARAARARHRLPLSALGRWMMRHRRVTAVMTAAALLPLVFVAPRVVSAATGSAPVTKIVFSIQERSPDHPTQLLPRSAIYVMNADGSDRHKIIGDDALDYSWSKWALSGTKIIFAAHRFGTDEHDQLYLMNADGSNIVQLTSTTWTTGQPMVSPDGRSVVFTAAWPEFPKFAIYRMDLSTLLVTNLSALASHSGSADADPRYSTDGSKIYFARSTTPHGRVVPTQIWSMSADGHHRTQISHDAYYNTDPQSSPSGGDVAYSSYRGPGGAADGDPSKLQAKLFDWFIVVHNLHNGTERVLNQGIGCATRPSNHPCAPDEGAAYVPVWAPDESSVAYISPLSLTSSCICATNADGSDPRVIFSSPAKIQYFDWQPMGTAPAMAAKIGSAVSPTRFLYLGANGLGQSEMFQSRSDRWGGEPLPLIPPGLVSSVSAPRWSADRQLIVFSANLSKVKVPPPPDAPPGHHRIRHYTIGWLGDLLLPNASRENVDHTQTFIMSANGGTMRELTTGSTEDWHDAIPDGEWRGNTQPDLSPDGKFVVVTNLSSTSPEAFLLRINLRTRAVYNLTNATAGAMPTTDFDPRFSPNGRKIAFAALANGASQIAVIDSKTGKKFRYLTNDGYLNLAPAWSPDGRYIVYASYRGTKPVSVAAARDGGTIVPGHVRSQDWYLVRVDTKTGQHRLLTSAADSPAFSPVYSPDGKQIAFIGLTHSPNQPDIYVMPSAGGPPQPLQVTLVTKELSLDWR